MPPPPSVPKLLLMLAMMALVLWAQWWYWRSNRQVKRRLEEGEVHISKRVTTPGQKLLTVVLFAFAIMLTVVYIRYEDQIDRWMVLSFFGAVFLCTFIVLLVAQAWRQDPAIAQANRLAADPGAAADPLVRRADEDPARASGRWLAAGMFRFVAGQFNEAATAFEAAAQRAPAGSEGDKLSAEALALVARAKLGSGSDLVERSEALVSRWSDEPGVLYAHATVLATIGRDEEASAKLKVGDDISQVAYHRTLPATMQMFLRQAATEAGAGSGRGFAVQAVQHPAEKNRL